MSHCAAPPIQTTPAQRGIRLKVADLEVRLGRSGPDVVSEISFAVQAGEVLGLVGESGSGKSTVAPALLGHARRGLRIPAGHVLPGGQNQPAPAPRELPAGPRAPARHMPPD